MMQGLSPRGEVRRKHGTNVRVDGQKPNRRRPYRTSGQRTAKSIIHQGAKHRFGDCTRKVTELTPGDLFRVASATEVAQRTYGTTDPGGVWHPVHRRECLTILLGTYAENGRCNRRTTNCIVFGTACLCLHWQPPPIPSHLGLLRSVRTHFSGLTRTHSRITVSLSPYTSRAPPVKGRDERGQAAPCDR